MAHSTEVYRPASGPWLAGAVMALAGLGLVSLVTSGDAVAMLRYGPLLLLVATAAWAVFWAPSVTVSDAGVSLRNVLRTVDLPWPAIQRVDTRYALTLGTAYGTYTAWAAPTSGRRRDAAGRSDVRGLPETTYGPAGTVRPGDLPDSPSGQAAALVRLRWEALRDAGYLDDPRLERQRPVVHWHGVEVTVLLVLALATATGLLVTHA
ncbi:MAG TPA: PH domain-containing protein [Actinotalea sp.]|nr:PH domain-containing protein [Actinotalea sp.]